MHSLSAVCFFLSRIPLTAMIRSEGSSSVIRLRSARHIRPPPMQQPRPANMAGKSSSVMALPLIFSHFVSFYHTGSLLATTADRRAAHHRGVSLRTEPKRGAGRKGREISSSTLRPAVFCPFRMFPHPGRGSGQTEKRAISGILFPRKAKESADFLTKSALNRKSYRVMTGKRSGGTLHFGCCSWSGGSCTMG